MSNGLALCLKALFLGIQQYLLVAGPIITKVRTFDQF